ncbi:MAG: PIN domain-containing protein [Actinomycetota bacterium]|nr:PIN domain-containing protein [Actinomycetota bacterium]
MRGYLVDTNVFLRLLTDDDAAQTPAAKNFIAKVIARKAQAYVTVPVVLELVWTLESYYELSRSDVALKLALLLNTTNLIVEKQDEIEQALEYYKNSKADFVDCYNAAFAKLNGDGNILSYDRHFDRLPGIKRSQPE